MLFNSPLTICVANTERHPSRSTACPQQRLQALKAYEVQYASRLRPCSSNTLPSLQALCLGMSLPEHICNTLHCVGCEPIFTFVEATLPLISCASQRLVHALQAAWQHTFTSFWSLMTVSWQACLGHGKLHCWLWHGDRCKTLDPVQDGLNMNITLSLICDVPVVYCNTYKY